MPNLGYLPVFILFLLYTSICRYQKKLYFCFAYSQSNAGLTPVNISRQTGKGLHSMKVLNKLDLYILKKFLLIFVGAFFICLFVFMMQFTWRYIDELIGKGLSLDILAHFFWYMGITMVPQALPLALLLASLITFGNLGESFELLAMKAAGIPLARIMRPIGFFALLMTGVSFYFQNSTSPDAQINLRTLLFSMKQQSPAVEIPEGTFYNGVPNINLFVQKKHAETGMLYQTIIYKTDQGFDRAQIVLADSARMEMTSDKMHLKLHLWNGEQFESLESSGGGELLRNNANEPYDHESFKYKQFIIDFDSNFNMMNKDMLSGMPSAKNMIQIEHSVDSLEHELDSIGRSYYADAAKYHYFRPELVSEDSLLLQKKLRTSGSNETFDLIVEQTPKNAQNLAEQSARSSIQSVKSELEWKSTTTSEGDRYIRRHWIEWHQKITLSLACLLFFMVGAPLGAIIRKGGLGLPTVISVIIFIIWYIINTSCMKMARDGSLNLVFGMWVSTAIITPFSILIAYKANKDSVVFNLDAYVHFFTRLLGIRTKRHMACKEVIIEEPDLKVLPVMITALKAACQTYQDRMQLLRAPNYRKTFFHIQEDHAVRDIHHQMTDIIEELSNSKDSKIIAILCEFPVLYKSAHLSPFKSHNVNMAFGIFFPLGFILWFRIWRFRLHLYNDIRTIIHTCDKLQARLNGDGEVFEDQERKTLIEQRFRRNKIIKRIIKVVLLLLIAGIICKTTYNSWQHYQQKKATVSSASGENDQSNSSPNQTTE